MRTVIVVALFVGCTDAPDPHAPAPCSAAVQQDFPDAETCEQACNGYDATATDECTAEVGGGPTMCRITAIFNGVKGCCLPFRHDNIEVTFFPCE